ncbi:MAG TPA: 2-dehydropantoate 2-reductase N-terminal domain-containing protein [Acidimicrobiia bacterium]|nr:2-dehydropantoate 2-reductase N-terminal domain-containing protein [Acidimicrobiia bacterium]
MRFVVYGAGAIGGVIGGRLFEHGHDVVLIARGAHHDAIARDGLRLVDPDRDITLSVPVVDHPAQLSFSADDVVVLAMKTQDTASALAALPADDLAIVCAQNGVENERLALRKFARVYGMCVMCPATHLAPGVVEQSSAPIAGLLDVGRAVGGVDPTAEAVAGALAASTFESVPRADIMRWKYNKLLMNLANAAEAVCGPDDPDTPELARRARREGVAVLEAAGIAFASRDEDAERRGTLLTPRPINGQTRGGGSSWQSLQRGTGHIEADYLNGEIVLLGRQFDVPTPVNVGLQHAANDAARRGDKPGATSAAMLLAALDA